MVCVIVIVKDTKCISTDKAYRIRSTKWAWPWDDYGMIMAVDMDIKEFMERVIKNVIMMKSV